MIPQEVEDMTKDMVDAGLEEEAARTLAWKFYTDHIEGRGRTK